MTPLELLLLTDLLLHLYFFHFPMKTWIFRYQCRSHGILTNLYLFYLFMLMNLGLVCKIHSRSHTTRLLDTLLVV